MWDTTEGSLFLHKRQTAEPIDGLKGTLCETDEIAAFKFFRNSLHFSTLAFLA